MSRAIGLCLLLALAAACSHEPPARPAATELAASPFRCGEHTCDARTHYCELINTDVQALPSTYTCKPLPARCVPGGEPPPGCDCFPRTTHCRNFCRREPTPGVQGFQLVCIGGG